MTGNSGGRRLLNGAAHFREVLVLLRRSASLVL